MGTVVGWDWAQTDAIGARVVVVCGSSEILAKKPLHILWAGQDVPQNQLVLNSAVEIVRSNLPAIAPFNVIDIGRWTIKRFLAADTFEGMN